MYSLLSNVSTVDPEGNQYNHQAIVIEGARIVWCGAEQDLPVNFNQQVIAKKDGQGHLVTPGLIDCHTHIVYAGDRAAEFQMKLQGMSYAQIAQSGGGIISTVKHTRAATEDELIEQSLPRIKALQNEGVTTVEIKSGYGLDLVNELKMLRVARVLGKLSGLRVRTSFLGAHTVGPEFKGNSQAYVDFLCKEMMPAVKESGLVDAVDVFCEHIAFSLEQTEQIFREAQRLDLPIKCHAEQLSNIGASALAAQFKALSCDHLEFLDEAGARALGQSGTTAVLLPGAYYFLREQKKPPIELLRQAGVDIAIATDCNPGSSPTASLLLMMSMACRFFDLSIPEILSAVTSNAAKALGLSTDLGSIAPGMIADLILWSVKDSAALCYYFGYPQDKQIMVAGKWQ